MLTARKDEHFYMTYTHIRYMNKVDQNVMKIAESRRNWRYEDMIYILHHHKTMTVREMSDHLLINQYVIKNMMDAMSIVPIKRHRKILQTVSLDTDCYEQLQKMSEHSNVPISNLINKIIKFYLWPSSITQPD
jgi:hypothetical protein